MGVHYLFDKAVDVTTKGPLSDGRPRPLEFSARIASFRLAVIDGVPFVKQEAQSAAIRLGDVAFAVANSIVCEVSIPVHKDYLVAGAFDSVCYLTIDCIHYVVQCFS